MAVAMLGCNQQRYKPAKWRPAARKSKKSDQPAVSKVVEAVDWTSLPGRRGTWSTLPNGVGGTLPYRLGSTLPGRSTLPSRRWAGSTLPSGRGMGTLPNRGIQGTLPERRWQKFQGRAPIGTLPQRRPMGTLPKRGKIYEAISYRKSESVQLDQSESDSQTKLAPIEREWKSLPKRTELIPKVSEAPENPLRK